jgi:salicylate hydroxylase
LQAILLQRVNELGIPIHLNSKVIAADKTFSGRIRLQTGEWISGDVIICADGIKSSIRAQIASANGVQEGSFPTGDAAYRLLISKERLKDDKKALKLLSQNIGMRWLGPGGHIMAYPIKNNTVYNMVLIHPQRPSQGTNENWTNQGSKQEMMKFYKDWNPMVQALLSYVPDEGVMEWTLNSHCPLPNWFENRCVLVGDACHPMLPYVGQGAAQAIEDAGVLTCALSLIRSSSAEDIHAALRVYELVRKERGEKIQNSAAETRKALHLPDGPEQRKRDEAIKRSGLGKGRNPDRWADRKWQEFMYDVDVMRECVEGWEELVEMAERDGLEHMNGRAH